MEPVAFRSIRSIRTTKKRGGGFAGPSISLLLSILLVTFARPIRLDLELNCQVSLSANAVELKRRVDDLELG